MSDNLPDRRSIRLPDFDYSSANWYYVTICVQDRICLLGKIVQGQMYQLPFGHLVNAFITSIPQHYPGVDIDTFQIMPHHVHAIIMMNICGRTPVSAQRILIGIS